MAEITQFNQVIEGYRKERNGFLWPAIAMLRKVHLLLVAVTVDDAMKQVVFVAAILVGSYVLLNSLRPYQVPIVNFVEQLKVGAVFRTVWFGSVLFGAAIRPRQRSTASIETVILIAVGFINVAFLLSSIAAGLYLVPGVVRYLYSRIVLPLLSKCGATPWLTKGHSRSSAASPRSRHGTRGSRKSYEPNGEHRKSLRHKGAPRVSAEESRRALLHHQRHHSQTTVENRMK